MKTALGLFVWISLVLLLDAAPKPAKAAGPVRFSAPGGVYVDELSLTLSSSSSTSAIHYTLDGSEPKRSSPSYSQPISITNSAAVKAKLFSEKGEGSATTTEVYTVIDKRMAEFSSNLPLVILSSSARYISRQRVPVFARFIDAGKERSEFTSESDFAGWCDVNVRGYSSLRYPKRSYTLRTKADDNTKLKTAILGMPRESDWVLYAPYSDKSLIRDALAYELSNQMGRYAPRTRFVEVFLHNTGRKLTMRDYLGVYVFEEKIKRGKDRVNIEKLGPTDTNETNITGGYLFKRDHFDQENPHFMTSRGCPLFLVDPEPEEITTAQKKWLARYMNKFEMVLYGPTFMNPSNGYARYLDVSSFIDQHWVVEATKNVDGFRFSAFLQKDRGGKLQMGPIWDWNLSFGNANYYDGYQPEKWYTPRLRETEICWFRQLSRDPDFTQKNIDRWGELRTNVFSAPRLLARVDEMAALLNEAQARNYKRWPILGRNVHPCYFTGDTYQEEINYMKQWIQRRIAWIDRQFISAPVLIRKDGPLQRGETIGLRAASGKIYYTLDGTDPRLPGGGVSPKAKLYDSPISLRNTATLFARVNHSSGWSSPTVGKFTIAQVSSIGGPQDGSMSVGTK